MGEDKKFKLPDELLILGAVALLGLAIQGLVTGKVYFRNPRLRENRGWVDRREMPFYYWLGIGVYSFSGTFVLFCVL